ncbi:unnamed protein product [Gulo gulo]|uniref:Uncharacterized protein n=1 Tax=Gulo gulo TaxID=48420 RepID=A0A9X9Q5G1_GULGU|nr:unnamed protein product [Gulo gulo]
MCQGLQRPIQISGSIPSRRKSSPTFSHVAMLPNLVLAKPNSPHHPWGLFIYVLIQ